jgi:hypothetical protein
MPCHDDRESPAAQTSTIKGLQARNDELAQLLCSLCRVFPEVARTGTERPGPIPWPPKVLEWWAKHEAQDRARLDALRKQYRDKVKEMDDEELSILHQVISSATAERQNPRHRS